MRRFLPLLVLFALAILPGRSQASPHVILLACDTLSTSPLQIHVQYGVQTVAGELICWITFVPQNAATHILSCSTTFSGASCAISGQDATWSLGTCIDTPQSIGIFDFVTDQSPACFNAYFDNPLLGAHGPARPEIPIIEKLCFSCSGIDAVPTQPSTWGKLKAIYR
jgi:hypothetical protein